MESFSALQQTNLNPATTSRQRHAVFQHFLSDDRKHGAATTKQTFNFISQREKSIDNTIQ